ncbi:MAG: aldose 1-epimerase [Lentisphaeria bacterium]|nr:aldose 1-epimerase [Lentisphaeria bacterium]
MLTLSAYGWEAAVSPQYGANLYRLAFNGFELLHTPPREETLAESPFLYGFPVLFPPNRIGGGAFRFEGAEYRLPLNEPLRGNHLHGIAYDVPWEVLSADSGFAELAMTFDERRGEFAGFPFPFRLRLSCRLRPGRVEQLLTVENRGERNMPCMAGFHTAFNMPRRVRFDAGDRRWEVGPPRFLPTGNLVPYDAVDPRTWLDPDAQRISMQFPAAPGVHAAELEYDGLRIRYEVDEKYRNWCVWNREAGSGFLCPEPMSCITNAVNLNLPPEKSGLLSLAPGGECAFRSAVIVR